jgi:hypothetical protein
MAIQKFCRARSPIKGDVKRKTLLPAGATEIFFGIQPLRHTAEFVS